jgi:hypothetical protein
MAIVPYNLGDAYEAKLFGVLAVNRVLPTGAVRAGAGGGPDLQFVHRTKIYNLEAKVDLKADYGQKCFGWTRTRGWYWSNPGGTTELYDHLGVLRYLNDKNLTPIKHRVDDESITATDKSSDQEMFEDRSFKIDIKSLYSYYQDKSVYYIQIGDGFGFYSLGDDPAGLEVPKFSAALILRFRAKTIHSDPIHNYRFYAVLKVDATRKSVPAKSSFSIEESVDQSFPPISP